MDAACSVHGRRRGDPVLLRVPSKKTKPRGEETGCQAGFEQEGRWGSLFGLGSGSERVSRDGRRLWGKASKHAGRALDAEALVPRLWAPSPGGAPVAWHLGSRQRRHKVRPESSLGASGGR